MILEHAEYVDLRQQSRAYVADPQGVAVGGRFEERADAVASYVLRWNIAKPSTVALIEEHFAAHVFAPFEYQPPGAAAPVRVIYRAPPRYQRRSATSTSVVVELIQTNQT